MGYSRPASKRPTNITLDEELVRQARLLTSNLSGTVEDLLREFVTREQGRRAAEDAAVIKVINGFNAFHQEHGLLSDDFPSLWAVAQFDVYRNPGRQRDTIPYVVGLQSGRFDRSTTRFVGPLVLVRHAAVLEHYLAPRFTVAGDEVMLDVFNLATVPAERLGPPVATLADEDARARLIRALDELVSQAWPHN